MRPAVALLLVFLSSNPLRLDAADWSLALTRVLPALVQIQTSVVLPDGTVRAAVCSGIVLHKKLHYILTAKHCTQDVHAVVVLGEPAEVVWSAPDPAIDLAIVQAAAPLHGQIRRRGRPLWIPMPLMAVGFAYGHEIPMVRLGHLGRVATWTHPDFVGLWYEADVPWAKGMSGGPVVDEEGYLVGIVLWSDGITGSGLAVQELTRQIPKQFWP